LVEDKAWTNPETTAADLVAALSAWRGAPVAGVEELSDTVDALVPPAHTSPEALWRARYAGVDVAGSLATWVVAYTTTCEGAPGATVDELRASFENDFEEGFPARTETGYKEADESVLCRGNLEAVQIAPALPAQVHSCVPRDGETAFAQVVDLRTGVLNEWPIADDWGVPVPFGERLAWTVVSTVPAEGLNAAKWTTRIVVADLEGNEINAIPLPISGQGEFDALYGLGNLLATNDTLVFAAATTSANGKYYLAAFDQDGVKLWERYSDVNGRGIDTLLPGYFGLGYIYDAATGTPRSKKYALARIDEICFGSANLSLEGIRGGHAWYGERQGRLSLTNSIAPYGADFPLFPSGTLRFARDELSGVDIRDNVRWRLDRDVVEYNSAEEWGRFVLITNTSGEQVLVDGLTGADVSTRYSTVLSRLEALSDSEPRGFAYRDRVFVRSAFDDGTPGMHLTEFTRSDLCG
jgi:hypothetical protein